VKQAGQSILREGEGESEGYYRYAELPSQLFEFAPCDWLGKCMPQFRPQRREVIPSWKRIPLEECWLLI
jgi:hypothetical protein